MSETAESLRDEVFKPITAEFLESLINFSMEAVGNNDCSYGYKRQKINSMLMPQSTKDALSIDLILEKIMKSLTLRDLLECRLVSKAWNCVATRLIKAVPNAFMCLNDDETITDYDALTGRIIEVDVENFPFWAFRVNLTRNIMEPVKMLKFIESYGKFVSRLKLEVEDCDIPILDPEITAIFLENLPNIRTFYFPVMSLNRQDLYVPREDNAKLVLNKLTTLELPKDPRKVHRPYFGHLLKTCPNLAEIRNMHNSLLLEVIEAEKMSCVKSLNYCGCNLPPNPSKLEVLPVLTSLEIVCVNMSPDRSEAACDNCDKFVDLISILNFNQHNLRHLGVGWPLNDPPLQWTQFKFSKLKSLEVSEDHCFPLAQKCAPSFLVLETVRIPITNNDYTLTDCLWNDVTPTVHTLDVDLWLTTYEIDLFAKTFPGIKCVRVNAKSCQDSCFAYWELWSVGIFKHLEKLEIRNWEIKNNQQSTSFSLDSFLTGFPPLIVRNLIGRKKVHIKPPYDEILYAKQENLATLLQLQELSISFVADDSLTPQDIRGHYPTLSDVSYKYAIGMIPGLRTRFCYDFRCKAAKAIEEALKSAANFVTICHRESPSFFT